MAELETSLSAKYPKLDATKGTSPVAIRCSETNSRCVQFKDSGCTTSHQTSEGWVVTELPEVEGAEGCSNCEFYPDEAHQGTHLEFK